MIQKRRTRLAVVLLILLLGVQLTGLSCLDEWSLPSMGGGIASYVDSSHDAAVAEADSCPCHLTFTSIPYIALFASCPSVLRDLPDSETLLLVDPALPFHPPLAV
jgi:hypothetical protein